MLEFEKILAGIASKCSVNYGAMGAVGYIYESVKDELRWAGLRAKFYTNLLMRIGMYFVMEDDKYNEIKVKQTTMQQDEITQKFLLTFGDGEK